MAAHTLETSSLQVLVRGLLRNKFHNGGWLRIGPDGKLYASTGDAQNGANAQNVNSLNGKILRMTRTARFRWTTDSVLSSGAMAIEIRKGLRSTQRVACGNKSSGTRASTRRI